MIFVATGNKKQTLKCRENVQSLLFVLFAIRPSFCQGVRKIFKKILFQTA
jgi:hypothetical protein